MSDDVLYANLVLTRVSNVQKALTDIKPKYPVQLAKPCFQGSYFKMSSIYTHFVPYFSEGV